jgi:hypothetical protein
MRDRLDTTLIVTGAPASGKTTVCNWIRDACRSRMGEHLDLRVDAVLRQMRARGELPRAETTADGALFLHDPAEDVPRALAVLAEIRASSELDALVEIPLDDDWFERYVDAYPDRAERTSVLCLSAPLEVRLSRNEARGSARIPAGNLAAMPASLSPGVAERVVPRVQDFHLMDTDSSLPQVRELSIAWAERALDRVEGAQRAAVRPTTPPGT